MKIKPIAFILVFLCALFVCRFSFADGCYIPEAKKKLPDIPIQRALVKYQHGTETLIIESTLDGEGNSFGWIIPVPNEPQRFEKVSPGLLKTFSLQIQPEINHIKPNPGIFGIPLIVIFAILIIISCFSIIRWGKKGIIVFLILSVLFFFGVPNFITYRAGAGPLSIANPSVEIKSREIVGNYEIFILEAKESFELNRWLEDNRFSKFPQKAIPIVDRYISDGWYFAVAKLQTTTNGISTPHPVLLEFETDRPVYPMQLTALPDSPVYLELFVVAENEAIPVNYNLQKEYCGYFTYKKIWSDFTPRDTKGFVSGDVYRLEKRIAHSDASKVMWDGCVVTKFADKISSSEMDDDIFFEFKDPRPYQLQMYSAKGRLDKSIFNATLVIIFGMPLLTIFYRITKKRKNRLSLSKLLLILPILWAIGFVLTYASIGKTTEVSSLHRYWPSNFSTNLIDVFVYPENNFSNGAELIKLLEKEGITNPITKEPILLEDSPGNIILEKDGDGFRIKLCLENGSFLDLF
jgi:hypothetical protein